MMEVEMKSWILKAKLGVLFPPRKVTMVQARVLLFGNKAWLLLVESINLLLFRSLPYISTEKIWKLVVFKIYHLKDIILDFFFGCWIIFQFSFQIFDFISQQWRGGAPIPGGLSFGACSVLAKNPNQFLVVSEKIASIYNAELNTWYAIKISI